MVPQNNPAGRLYDVLGKFKDASTGDAKIDEVWAQILDVEKPLVRE
jgi:hypothetical protein